MKIKTDFVTNSSSSSFVVLGATIRVSDMEEGYASEVCRKLKIDKCELSEDIYSYMDKVTEGSDLKFASEYGDYYDGVSIGIPYTKMNDDESMGQFKQRVKNEIKRVFGIDIKPDHIELCWMDG